MRERERTTRRQRFNSHISNGIAASAGESRANFGGKKVRLVYVGFFWHWNAGWRREEGAKRQADLMKGQSR